MVYFRASLVTQMVKNLCVVQETRVWFPELGRSPGEGNGNPLQNSCLENPTDGRAWWATQSMVYLRPHISWSPFPGIHNCIAYFLLGTCGPGLVLLFWLLFCSSLGCGPEKAMAPHSSTLAWKVPWTEEPGRLQSMGSLRVGHDWATSLSLFTFMHWRRNGNPLQCSCLENPRNGGAWLAAVYGVAQTRLKRLSSSSSSRLWALVSLSDLISYSVSTLRMGLTFCLADRVWPMVDFQELLFLNWIRIVLYLAEISAIVTKKRNLLLQKWAFIWKLHYCAMEYFSNQKWHPGDLEVVYGLHPYFAWHTMLFFNCQQHLKCWRVYIKIHVSRLLEKKNPI